MCVCVCVCECKGGGMCLCVWLAECGRKREIERKKGRKGMSDVVVLYVGAI